ncbi:hypothetical protein CKW46_07470 [Mycobacterium liflandii]|nr:hypothetical protein BB170200_01141 [Mycobacterium marinum]ULL09553.1 hypothetical protein CKW46_07470 [Mycobacterium liflandii]
MNVYQVLQEHHRILKGLCQKITIARPGSAHRGRYLDELLLELDIHFRIEDDIYYPALSAASTLLAIAHAEHRQVFDQLATFLRTSPLSSAYEDEWCSFTTVLEAHADEEERDMIPVPPSVKLSDEDLDVLGSQMQCRIEELRNSKVQRLRVRGRTAVFRAMHRPHLSRDGHHPIR